jgi:hypothetical protein
MSKVCLDVLASSVLFKAFLKQVTEIANDTTNGSLFYVLTINKGDTCIF